MKLKMDENDLYINIWLGLGFSPNFSKSSSAKKKITPGPRFAWIGDSAMEEFHANPSSYQITDGTQTE